MWPLWLHLDWERLHSLHMPQKCLIGEATQITAAKKLGTIQVEWCFPLWWKGHSAGTGGGVIHGQGVAELEFCSRLTLLGPLGPRKFKLWVTDTVAMPPGGPGLASSCLPAPVSFVSCLIWSRAETCHALPICKVWSLMPAALAQAVLAGMLWRHARHGEQETAVSGDLSWFLQMLTYFNAFLKEMWSFNLKMYFM